MSRCWLDALRGKERDGLHCVCQASQVDGTSISLKKSLRSLGVHLDDGLRAGTHCERVVAKLKTTASVIRRCAPRKRGLSYRTMEILYGGLIKPVACYAAAAWFDLTNERDRRKHRSAQRQALLTLTRAYRTASTDALCVLAGEVPISLLLHKDPHIIGCGRPKQRQLAICLSR